MLSWTFALFSFQIGLTIAVALLWMKLHRPPKEDQRLSKGLQLLQAKIAILEDLSDRTDVQVKQLTSLMDKKRSEIHEKMQDAEKQISKIRQSMDQSLQIAEIFQDKIPHSEIIEREANRKYIHAAQLAHQGVGADEICRQTGLDRAEVEFISKVNREQLMFAPEELPAWAKQAASAPAAVMPPAIQQTQTLSRMSAEVAPPATPLIIPSAVPPSLSDLGQLFRSAIGDTSIEELMTAVVPASAPQMNAHPTLTMAQQMAQEVAEQASLQPITFHPTTTKVLISPSDKEWSKGQRTLVKEMDSSKISVVKFPRLDR